MINWSAENTIFSYLKITKPWSNKMEENLKMVKSHEMAYYLVPLPP